jgi:hypothetical protein
MIKVSQAEKIATLRTAHSTSRARAVAAPALPVTAWVSALLVGAALFIGGLNLAHAAPPPDVVVSRDDARAARIQRREELRPDIQRQDDAEMRRRVELVQDRGANNDNRRNSRMTPEERRDLRRQINEAGNDLYNRR